MGETRESGSIGYEQESLIKAPGDRTIGAQSHLIRESGYASDLLGAIEAQQAMGLDDRAVVRATLGRELGSKRFWKAVFTFGWGDYADEMSGRERIRRTNELKRLEADRQAEEALARKRKMNLAAGLALMQNANMVNFFR